MADIQQSSQEELARKDDEIAKKNSELEGLKKGFGLVGAAMAVTTAATGGAGLIAVATVAIVGYFCARASAEIVHEIKKNI